MKILNLSKAEWSELIAGWVEGFVTTAVVLTLLMLALGIEAYVALIPIIIAVCTGISGVVICLAVIFGRRMKNNERD